MEDSRMCIVCKCCVRVISTIFTYEKKISFFRLVPFSDLHTIAQIDFKKGSTLCGRRLHHHHHHTLTTATPTKPTMCNRRFIFASLFSSCFFSFPYFLLLSFFAFVVNAVNILLSHCRSVYIFLRHLVRRSRMLSILACVPFTILSSTGCRTDGIGRQKWENKVIIIRYIACHMQTSRPNFLHFGRRAACHRSHMWVATGEWWVLVVFGTNYSASESICQ